MQKNDSPRNILVDEHVADVMELLQEQKDDARAQQGSDDLSSALEQELADMDASESTHIVSSGLSSGNVADDAVHAVSISSPERAASPFTIVEEPAPQANLVANHHGLLSGDVGGFSTASLPAIAGLKGLSVGSQLSENSSNEAAGAGYVLGGAGGISTFAAAAPTSDAKALLCISNGYPNARWNYSTSPGSDGLYGLGKPVEITFSFPTVKPSYYGADKNSFVAFTAQQQAAAKSILASISEFTNITFKEVSSGGQIILGNANLGSTYSGYGYYPTFTNQKGGDVWLNSTTKWGSLKNDGWTPGAGGTGYLALMHELGHALGLKHPHEGTYRLPSSINDIRHTVMTYNQAYDRISEGTVGNISYYTYLRAETYMPIDMEALQYLYGANMATRSGNDVYKWDKNPIMLRTIWDGGGNDTIDCSNQTTACEINLEPGSLSSIGYKGKMNLAIAKGVIMENAIGGSGNDIIKGNSADNRLEGGDGNDTIDGGAGKDTMVGGKGDDVYYVDDPNDVVIENANEGTDTVISTASDYTLPDNVENLILAGTGNIHGTGNALNNKITGNAGNNILDGAAGADTMAGGKGNDTYYVDNIGDVVIENANEGIDSVYSSINYTLGKNLENLVLIGSANINGTGNTLNNKLTGNDGNNVLNGGAGADTMAGGKGDDTYYVDNIKDAIIENANEGTDTVISTISYTLGNNLENLTLTGSAHIKATGNALNNVLTGNAGNNILDGGAGADTMAGGKGNDTYYVDNVGDVVIENANEGIDTVMSSVSYTIGDNIENLTLTGKENINATGNALNNKLTGNAGNNVLNGGAGADTMAGGKGNDTYYVDNVKDVVIENANEGTDTVISTVSYILGNNLENLELAGAANINGIGNKLANKLTGNDGNNILNGGLGADTMAGGKGDDTYYVDNAKDVVIENANEGTDTVISTVSYTLGNNLENLTLSGAAHINGTGNALNNVLTGNNGNNVLNGGTGADTMAGGKGNDTYYVDDANDVVIEKANEGTDLVYASVNYTLGNNIENLTLTGTANLNGTGNALNNKITGNAGNNVLNGGAGADTMAGGKGNDTYYVDNVKDVVIENANEGTDTVISTVSYTLGNNLENLTLAGAAHINGTGNKLNNVLTGNDGNNILNGGLGADTMAGGKGNDTYYVDNIKDVVTENANEGTDTVISTVSYTLGDNLENLTLSGAAHINGTGNALNNVITGNNGNNVLNGGTGADTMAGGAGNDTYYVDNAGDVVIEKANQGIDTVISSIAYTLGSNIENLTLTGSGNLNGTGNALNNKITGNDGNNVLNGGAGVDTMIGGKGDDTYYVDNVKDVVIENANEGTDTVISSVNYKLGNNLENLTLSGAAHINGTGNALNNVITGNAGNNILDGGAGADTMAGGKGNDTYYVDNVGDVVTENANEGTDTVISTISYTLGDNLENLTLTGKGNLNATGNALNNKLTGNTGNNVLNGGAGADTMAGGAGNDTYYVDNVKDVIIENANQGTDTVMSTISYALGNNLENLVLLGSANINAIGNSLANKLTGNDGNNILNGGLGADTMAGGKGDDTYYVDNVKDVVIENANEGNDVVFSTVSYTLGNNLEDLELLGAAHINATGNALNNRLVGNTGNNVLNGGVGADTMAGGKGNDTYYVDNAGDVVIENANEGTDLVYSSIDYTLGNNLENLTLTGTANLKGTGNALNNKITGNAGNNVLDGGAGADTMAGGKGNDTYYVDNVKDVVIENANEGIDTVISSINYTLGNNIENLTLTGTANLNGTGNALNNVLTGNNGNNVLNGGLGADTMAGGKGNDTYYVDDAGDVVIEGANAGIDTVISSINYTLGSNLENLTLAGSGNLNGTGNALNNKLVGNGGNNILDGGAGADTMAGGKGDDTYYVDNLKDLVVENANEGIDTVLSTISYKLTSNVENLTLLGSSNINGTGNTLNNELIGNAGNNRLDGGAGNDKITGGHGQDTLIGGAGDDTFVFTNSLDSLLSAPDRILDFSVNNDKLDFSKFDANPGTPGMDHFTFIGGAAFDTNVAGQLRFEYDSKTHIGTLYGTTSTGGQADFAIELSNVEALNSGCFIF